MILRRRERKKKYKKVFGLFHIHSMIVYELNNMWLVQIENNFLCIPIPRFNNIDEWGVPSYQIRYVTSQSTVRLTLKIFHVTNHWHIAYQATTVDVQRSTHIHFHFHVDHISSTSCLDSFCFFFFFDKFEFELNTFFDDVGSATMEALLNELISVILFFLSLSFSSSFLSHCFFVLLFFFSNSK